MTGLPLVLVHIAGPEIYFSLPDNPGQTLPSTPDIMGTIICSDLGRGFFQDEVAALPAGFIFDRIDIIDATGPDPVARRLTILEGALRLALAARNRSARRNVQLVRNLAQIRATQELTQENFQKLERFLLDGNLAKRSETHTVPPAPSLPAIGLSDGQELRQRLPGASAGLSDVAVHLSLPAASRGASLEARLSLCETGQTLASWRISGSNLRTGWHRLGLPVSLDEDRMTPELSLIWHGPSSVSIAAGMHHPDARHQARLSDGARADTAGSVIAMRLWAGLPGCAAAMAADAHAPISSAVEPAQPLLMDLHQVTSDALRSARSLDPEATHFGYRDELAGLLVHPFHRGIATGILLGAIPDGATGITVDIRSANARASDIEFRLAVAPHDLGPLDQAARFEGEAARRSEWVRLSAEQRGQVHLQFPAPLGQSHDLYVMTRMAEGSHSSDWAWAVFERVNIGS